MTQTCNRRGHTIFIDDDGNSFYDDTGKPFDWDVDVSCKKCGALPGSNGHDPCIKNLPDVKFACCGHGIDKYAYIMFNDGKTIRGDLAIAEQERLKK